MLLKLDRLYSAWANRHPFFYEGWGRRDVLDDLLRLGPRKLQKNLARRTLAAPQVTWTPARPLRGTLVRQGVFRSPYYYAWKRNGKSVREILPPEVAFARVELVQPLKRQNDSRPLVFHFAATGDEGFARRRGALALPLARRGITSAILENPCYGQRRPTGQRSSRIRTFSEFLQMSRAAQDEGLALLNYFREAGYGPIGVTGISMGGYVALATAAQLDFPCAVAACIPCHSAAPVYTEGVLSEAVAWDRLAADLEGRAGGDPRAYMRSLLDLSDLRHLPAPDFARTVIMVGADEDQYIPRESVEIARDHWHGSELRWVTGDHVGTFLFHLGEFHAAIVDSLERIRDFPGAPHSQARRV